MARGRLLSSTEFVSRVVVIISSAAAAALIALLLLAAYGVRAERLIQRARSEPPSLEQVLRQQKFAVQRRLSDLHAEPPDDTVVTLFYGGGTQPPQIFRGDWPELQSASEITEPPYYADSAAGHDLPPPQYVAPNFPKYDRSDFSGYNLPQQSSPRYYASGYATPNYAAYPYGVPYHYTPLSRDSANVPCSRRRVSEFTLYALAHTWTDSTYTVDRYPRWPTAEDPVASSVVACDLRSHEQSWSEVEVGAFPRNLTFIAAGTFDERQVGRDIGVVLASTVTQIKAQGASQAEDLRKRLGEGLLLYNNPPHLLKEDVPIVMSVIITQKPHDPYRKLRGAGPVKKTPLSVFPVMRVSLDGIPPGVFEITSIPHDDIPDKHLNERGRVGWQWYIVPKMGTYADIPTSLELTIQATMPRTNNGTEVAPSVLMRQPFDVAVRSLPWPEALRKWIMTGDRLQWVLATAAIPAVSYWTIALFQHLGPQSPAPVRLSEGSGSSPASNEAKVSDATSRVPRPRRAWLSKDDDRRRRGMRKR